jgi:oxygen-dependent protoporphyrinogen oxidase
MSSGVRAGGAAGHVVVAGGGVTGLTAAYRLLDRGFEVTVLEAADRPGGKLRNVTVGGFTLPAGADSFLARKPWAVDLCRELGIADELEAPGASGSYLWTDRGLVRALKDAPFGIPGDVGDVLRWPGLSRAGRRRALGDLVRRKRSPEEGDETLGGLLRRRLGDEATDLAIAPLLGGLFAGDVDGLSVRATFPELERWEASQGSLIRGSQATTRRTRRGPAPGPMFLRPRGGVQRLTDALAERVETAPTAEIRTGVPVEAIAQLGAAYRVDLEGGADLTADAVILALPAAVSAEVLAPLPAAAEAAEELADITAASTGVVLLVYPEETIEALPAGTGFVVPRGKAPMTACTWLSRKWPSEAFGTRAVLRCFVGGVGFEGVLDAPDPDLIEACSRHLAAVLELPTQPEEAAVVRWPGSMPQYEIGHIERVTRIRGGLPTGIAVAGQPYDGVGVPDCVRGATEAADAVAAHLGWVPPTTDQTGAA